MRVEFSDSIREIDAADWDSVVRESGAPVFCQHAYVSACEQAPLTAVDAFAYFVVRDGDKPVAVTPAYLQTAANPLRRLHEVYPEALGRPALLSHAWHCYDAHVPATAEVLPVCKYHHLAVGGTCRRRYCSITFAVGPLDHVASSLERRPAALRKVTTSGPPGCSTATDQPSAGVADSASTPVGR